MKFFREIKDVLRFGKALYKAVIPAILKGEPIIVNEEEILGI